MNRKTNHVIALSLVLLFGADLSAQSNQYHDRMAVRIAERQRALREHTAAMEQISDPARLQPEILKHFKMVEDFMALILEHRNIKSRKSATALLDEIVAHSRAMESIRDTETLSREMVKHQQMLDRLLERLQKR